MMRSLHGSRNRLLGVEPTGVSGEDGPSTYGIAVGTNNDLVADAIECPKFGIFELAETRRHRRRTSGASTAVVLTTESRIPLQRACCCPLQARGLTPRKPTKAAS